MRPVTAPVVEVYAGDTTSFHSYTIEEDGTPVDLVAAGWSNWVAQWRKTPTHELVIALSVDVSRARSGQISVWCSAEQSDAMGGAGVWDLQASRTGEVRTFARGTTSWERDVSRA